MQFWREQSAWPYVHYSTVAQFYFALAVILGRYARSASHASIWLISVLVSALGIYVWEQIELVASVFAGELREKSFDSLIGDPTIGWLAILSFAVLDYASLWHEETALFVPWYVPIAQFIVGAAPTFFANHLVVGQFRLGMLLLWAVQMLSLALFYLPFTRLRRGPFLRLFALMVALTALLAITIEVLTSPIVTSWTIVFFYGLGTVSLGVFATIAARARGRV